MEARTFQINDLYEPALTYEVRCLARFFNIMINEYYVTKYCCEDLSLIENYELAINDHTQTWDCHHRGEVLPCGRFSIDDLKKFGLYYNRPAAELIFLTKAEHNRLHKRGVPIGPMSEDHKKAIGEAQRGIPKSEEHKRALSDALKGVPLSEEHKKAIGKALKGHSVSEEHRAKLSKKILQFTKSGEFIREWPSVREAERELGIARSSICSCCNEKLKSAGGFIWQYSTL